MPEGNITKASRKPIIDLCKIVLSTGIRRDNSCQYWSGKKVVDYPACERFLTMRELFSHKYSCVSA